MTSGRLKSEHDWQREPGQVSRGWGANRPREWGPRVVAKRPRGQETSSQNGWVMGIRKAGGRKTQPDSSMLESSGTWQGPPTMMSP